MVRVKICGITCEEDAMAAVDAGADALGFVFAKSPRRVTPEQAREIIRRLPPLVTTVGVFVDEDAEHMVEIRKYCGLNALQLHGGEPESFVESLKGTIIKAARVQPSSAIAEDAYPTATLLLDTYNPASAGGTGETFDWNLAVRVAARRRIILAGGLTPDNVARAVATVKPYAVDVSSGVEKQPGRKDHAKVEHFIRRAKSVE